MQATRQPRLTFFVELDGEALARLFRPALVELLARSGAAISMAMLDLSPGREAVIRALNGSGVPVTAWLVLDEADGYWLTADNPRSAHRRYSVVRDWIGAANLEIDAVGLDIETPHQDALSLVREGTDALMRLLRQRRAREVLARAARAYADLIDRIHRDGFRVETYQFPVILDERQARSTLLQRVLGLVDVRPDREVLMLYRSMLPGPAGETLVDAYGPEADAIGVGITGGGVEFLLQIVGKLDLDRLLVDLRRARRYTPHLYVFSLEGCVEGGYLERLCRADLERPVRRAPLAPLSRAARSGLRSLLRAERLWDRLLREG
jgi:hypothetical protein